MTTRPESQLSRRKRQIMDIIYASGCKASNYAQHLLEVVRSLHSVRCLSPVDVAMARKSQLDRRRLAILDGRRNRRAITRLSVVLAAAILAIATVVSLVAMKATAPEAKPTAPAIMDEEAWFEQRSDDLCKQLSDKNPNVRIHVAEKLGKCVDDQGAVIVLKRALDDSVPQVRYTAAVSLAKLGHVDDQVAVALGECFIAGRAPGMRNGASAFDINYVMNRADIAAKAKAAVPLFIQAAKENTLSQWRCDALRILGKIGDPAAIPMLRETLRDSDAGCRCTATRALAAIGPPAKEAAEELREAMGNGDFCAKLSGEALAKIGAVDVLIDEVKKRDRMRLEPAVLGLAFAKDHLDEAAKVLTAEVGRGNWEAAESLIVLGDVARPALPEFLNMARTQGKIGWASRAVAAAKFAAKFGATDEFLPIFIKQLESGTPDERSNAAVALGEMGPAAAPATKALLKAVKAPIGSSAREMGGQVQCNAVEALGKIKSDDPDVIPALISALHSPKMLLRWSAELSLGQYGPAAAAAVPHLITLMRRAMLGDVSNVLEAIKALTGIGPGAKDALPALIQNLKNKYSEDETWAALSAIGPDAAPAVPVLFAQGMGNWDRNRAKKIIAAIGSGAVPFLVQKLHGTQGEQDYAAECLAQMDSLDKSLLPTLVGLLEQNDRADRVSALRALAKMGASAADAVGPMRKLLTDPEPWVQIEAATALRKIAQDRRTQAADYPTRPDLQLSAGPFHSDATTDSGRAVPPTSASAAITQPANASLDLNSLEVRQYPADNAKPGLCAIGPYCRLRFLPFNSLYASAASGKISAGSFELVGRLSDDSTPIKVMDFVRDGHEIKILVALSPKKPAGANYIWGKLPQNLPPGRYHVELTAAEYEEKDGQLVPAPKDRIRAFYQLECHFTVGGTPQGKAGLGTSTKPVEVAGRGEKKAFEKLFGVLMPLAPHNWDSSASAPNASLLVRPKGYEQANHSMDLRFVRGIAGGGQAANVIVCVMKPGYAATPTVGADDRAEELPPWRGRRVFLWVGSDGWPTAKADILAALNAADGPAPSPASEAQAEGVIGIDREVFLKELGVVSAGLVEVAREGTVFMNTKHSSRGAVIAVAVAVCGSRSEANAIFELTLAHMAVGNPRAFAGGDEGKIGDRRDIWPSWAMFVRDNVFVHVNCRDVVDVNKLKRLDKLLAGKSDMVQRGRLAEIPRLKGLPARIDMALESTVRLDFVPVGLGTDKPRLGIAEWGSIRARVSDGQVRVEAPGLMPEGQTTLPVDVFAAGEGLLFAKARVEVQLKPAPGLTRDQRWRMLVEAMAANTLDADKVWKALTDVGHVSLALRKGPLKDRPDEASLARGVRVVKYSNDEMFLEYTDSLNRLERGLPPKAWIARLADASKAGFKLNKYGDGRRVAIALTDEVRRERDRLLTEAAEKIRTGLLTMAEQFPKLRKTAGKPLAELLPKGQPGRIDISASRWVSDAGAAKDRVSKADSFAVNIHIEPLRFSAQGAREWQRWHRLNLEFNHLALMGNVSCGAGEPKLDAAIKKLIGQALAPLQALDRKVSGQPVIYRNGRKVPLFPIPKAEPTPSKAESSTR